MIIPVGFCVLVRPDPIKKQFNNDKIAIPDNILEQQRFNVDTGIVLSIGDLAWKGIEGGVGNPWAIPGDHVVYAKYGGKVLEDDERGEKVVLLQDKDILGVITNDRGN